MNFKRRRPRKNPRSVMSSSDRIFQLHSDRQKLKKEAAQQINEHINDRRR